MKSVQPKVSVRFSKSQLALIWPGLDHLIRADLTRQKTGQAITSYRADMRTIVAVIQPAILATLAIGVPTFSIRETAVCLKS